MGVTKSRFSNTIFLGDVKNISGENLPQIDLLVGGSPCQGFSYSGKMLNFNDRRSKLFFEFVRVLKQVKPKYFLLENVKMKQEYQDIISGFLGVEPIKLNSSLTSAQNRVRLYWANFKIDKPRDCGITLQDILETSQGNSERLYKAKIVGRRINSKGKREDSNKSLKRVQCLEVSPHQNKSNCLTTLTKDTVLTPLGVGRHVDVYNRKLPYRNYTIAERCRLMNLPDNYCNGISDYQAVKATGNAWEIGMVKHIFRKIFTNGTITS